MKTAIINSSMDKTELMQIVHSSLGNGIRSAKAVAPRKWLLEKSLSVENSGAVFNSGQMHHRKEQAFKDALESIGMLKRSDTMTNAGQIPYSCFGNYSILFPLRNEQKEVVNFYAMGLQKIKTCT
jgi:hypothetical protein